MPVCTFFLAKLKVRIRVRVRWGDLYGTFSTSGMQLPLFWLFQHNTGINYIKRSS